MLMLVFNVKNDEIRLRYMGDINVELDVKLEDGELIAKVEGYDNYYVTSNGRVYSIYGRGRWLKQRLNKKNGYYLVDLFNNGRVKTHLVHRLMALAFIENPDNLPMVDHINRNRTDNRVENLRWATNKDNRDNRIRRGGVYYNKHRGKFQAVWYPDPNTSKVKTKLFLTQEQAQEHLDKHNVQRKGVVV